jgi:DNA (cytosine-5)-methyltransferase 1
MKKKFKVGSLFAGVGGICLGFMQTQNNDAEYEVVWANEIDEYACETYRTNFKHTLIEGDINLILRPERIPDVIAEKEKAIIELEESIKTQTKKEEIKKIKERIQDTSKYLRKLINQKNENYFEEMHEAILSEEIDVLNGGFPCQAFSIAGEQKGFKDERGNLFLSIIDLINQLGERHKKPRILFLENVKNLKSHDNNRTYKVIKQELEKTGYQIYESVLNTMTYSDLPQNRERIYIIGFLDPKDAEKFDMFSRLSELKKLKNTQDRVDDVKKIIDYSVVDSKYYYTKDKYPHYFITQDEFESKNNSKKSVRINLEEDINEKYQFYQVRRSMYVRKNKSDVCPTLTANMGTGGHNVPLIRVNNGVRKITPTEAFRLQGFPVGNGYVLPTEYKNRVYGDANLYKQAGNAVSVPVIKLIAEEVLKILSE